MYVCVPPDACRGQNELDLWELELQTNSEFSSKAASIPENTKVFLTAETFLQLLK